MDQILPSVVLKCLDAIGTENVFDGWRVYVDSKRINIVLKFTNIGENLPSCQNVPQSQSSSTPVNNAKHRSQANRQRDMQRALRHKQSIDNSNQEDSMHQDSGVHDQSTVLTKSVDYDLPCITEGSCSLQSTDVVDSNVMNMDVLTCASGAGNKMEPTVENELEHENHANDIHYLPRAPTLGRFHSSERLYEEDDDSVTNNQSLSKKTVVMKRPAFPGTSYEEYKHQMELYEKWLRANHNGGICDGESDIT